MGGFQKLGVLWVVLVIRIIVFGDLYWSPLFWESLHLITTGGEFPPEFIHEGSSLTTGNCTRGIQASCKVLIW